MAARYSYNSFMLPYGWKISRVENFVQCLISRVDKSKSVELLVTAVDWNASSLIVTRTNELLQCYVSTLTRNHTC